MAHRIRSTIGSSNMCQNCGVLQKFPGHDYCGKTCAAEAGKQRKATQQRVGGSGPPIPVVGPTSVLEPDASDLCENCYARPKSQDTDEDGTVITQQYCGVRCYISSQRSIPPVSNIPAPAAAPISRNLSSLLLERVSTPIGRSISLMMQDRWQSEELGTPQLKSVYRIDLSKQVYRRFDLALQMNDGCPVTATYYGGIATCGIANDKDPAPCGSESCQVCDVLCSAFGNMPYGASSRDGAYGPGLYTNKNPALAHHVAISDDDHQVQDTNYLLIQCRVVTRENSGPGSKLFAGSIDDSGATFCAQSTAIIPTHLLIYRLNASPNTQYLEGSANVNSASMGPSVSAVAHTSAGLAQPKSSTNTGSSETNLKAAKGKGKARAKRPLHLGEGSGGMGSGHGGGNTTSGTGSSALSVPPPPPPPLNPPTGDTTQTTHRSGSINSGTGPAVAPPPPPPTLRGLPNTPAPPPGAAKKGAVGDPQSTPLPPSPAPTLASNSGTIYLTAAQEKAKLAQATGMGPAAAPPSPPLRGLPYTPAPPPGPAKKGAVGDPPLPPSPAPTPASKSGTIYLTAAQEKAQLAQATSIQAVPPGALNAAQSSGSNAAQSSGSNATQVVQAPKAASRGDPFEDAEEFGTAGGHMPQAIYQTNLASPGPGSFYVQAQGGFVPIQNPPQGLPLFLLGVDGNFYTVPTSSATAVYPPITTSVVTPIRATAQGLLSSPAPDPATAALRAMIRTDPLAPPNNLSSPAQARVDDDGAFDYFNKDGTGYTARPGRPASVSYESNLGSQQRVATRQGTYPLPASPPNNLSSPAHARVDDDGAYDYFNKDGTGYPSRPGRPVSVSYESNRGGQQKVATRQGTYPLPASPPNNLSSPAHARADDDGAFDYFNKDSAGYTARPGRPASVSYESNRGGQQKVATRQGTYPLPGHGGDPLGASDDDDLRTSAAMARNFMSCSKGLNNRLDEDEDDDSNFLVPDEALARRQ